MSIIHLIESEWNWGNKMISLYNRWFCDWRWFQLIAIDISRCTDGMSWVIDGRTASASWCVDEGSNRKNKNQQFIYKHEDIIISLFICIT